jgi:glutamate/tyrosine decarboxylase-like PLP-dependent enzyme
LYCILKTVCEEIIILLGTTVLGAFDPIPEIADLCSKYKLWLHVDAAWGGGALISKKHRHLLEGIERYVYKSD